MDPFPTRADLNDRPDAIGDGHLWMFEYVEGLPLRFTLQSDGRLVFGGRTARYDDGSEPPAVSPAIETVRSAFRRDAFREAVSDPGSITFSGIATCQHRIEYDWGRLPAFLGYDVHGADLHLPDAAHASFDRLGLTPAPTLARERRADAFDPDRYAFPDSTWASEPVAGVVLADKHGWRGRLLNQDRPSKPTASFESPDSAAEALVTDELAATGSVETTLRRVARRHRATLVASDIDPTASAFRSAVAKALQRRST